MRIFYCYIYRMKKEKIAISEHHIIHQIYLIRDKKVILDTHLALLYNVETKRLNEQVRRNINRFPDDFMFQLTKGRMDYLEVAKCVLKLGRKKNFAICIH